MTFTAQILAIHVAEVAEYLDYSHGIFHLARSGFALEGEHCRFNPELEMMSEAERLGLPGSQSNLWKLIGMHYGL